MVANLPPQFHEKEAELKKAGTLDEKIAILEEMLSIMPKHKSSEKLQAEIKTKISRYRKEKEKPSSTAKRATAPIIEREGAGQVAVCGPPNSGKSTLVASLTKANTQVGDYPFTTTLPVPGMLTYQDIKIQLIDTPSLDPDFSEGWLGDILRKSDSLLFLFDLASDSLLEELEKSLQVLENFKIKVPENFVFSKKTIWAGNKIDVPKAKDIKEVFREFYQEKIPGFLEISGRERLNLENLKEEIFRSLEIIRVYTKKHGHPPDLENPYTVKRNASILELAENIHKDISSNFKYARVWRTGSDNVAIAGRDFLLQDKDVVEVHT